MSEKSSVSRAKYSILIGVVCIFSYLVSYYSRNLASVTGSAMQDMGFYTKSFFTSMTTVYYITYASGQLFNGIMGRKEENVVIKINGRADKKWII